jgi:hypothetical protein
VLASLEGELSRLSAVSIEKIRSMHTCALVLQAVHSRRRTTFLVVLALLWKTGLV